MRDFTNKNRYFHNFESIFVDSVTWGTIIIVILYFIGASSTTTSHLLSVLFIAKAFLGFYLMYRFYPSRSDREFITGLDRKVAFACGIFIVAMAIIDHTMPQLNEIRNYISFFTGNTVNSIEKYFQITH